MDLKSIDAFHTSCGLLIVTSFCAFSASEDDTEHDTDRPGRTTTCFRRVIHFVGKVLLVVAF
jgi:hypothetical protein